VAIAVALAVHVGAAGERIEDVQKPLPIATWTFDNDPVGKTPEGWSIRETHGTGRMGSWKVTSDPSAPTPPNVLGLSTQADNKTFNLAIADKTAFKDVDLRVRIRADSGEKDQGGGLIWRCRDENNYYICRVNPLEDNYRLYRVVGGKREQLASADVKAEAGRWYGVRVVMSGDRMVCYFDGEKVLEAKDGTFKDAGKIGLWTKADASSSFDDLTVFPVAPPSTSSAPSTGTTCGQDTPPPFVERMRLRDARTARVSSWDRTGGNQDWITIKPGQTAVLADIAGPGCIKHIYWTYIIEKQDLRRRLFRDVILRMYWDDEKTPSVESPIGDFFGVSNGLPRPLRSLDLVVNPGGLGGETSVGLNCYFPMPFSKHARIDITYDTPPPADPIGIWYHIDYEVYPASPEWLVGAGRFHAQFRHCRSPKDMKAGGINKTGSENYVILEARGQGHLAGYVLGVDNITGGWWGEGDDMVFIDGESWPPSFHGTGTEEIFGGGACPSVEYSGPYTGFHLVENRDGDQWYGKNAMYRSFVRDPIRFRESIRVTLEHGHANDMANDYSSVAYWYQREPHAPFPPLPSRAERQPISDYPTEPSDFAGAIEAEKLFTTAKTSGKPLFVARHGGPKWSGGRWLWYHGTTPGDFFSVAVPVKDAGKYEVLMNLVKATDFGTFQLHIDGKPVGQPFDGYNGTGGSGPTHVVKAEKVGFGKTELTAGTHPFEFRLVGKNTSATSYMVGLDCILLRRCD